MQKKKTYGILRGVFALGKDGFIPLILKGGEDNESLAWLLPFQVEWVTEEESAGVYDLYGVEPLNRDGTPEWRGYMPRLEEIFRRDRRPSGRIRLTLHCNIQELRENAPKDPLRNGTFTGVSLMLPVLVALWRKDDSPDALPNFDPYRMLFTGAVDEEMRLKKVDIAAKELLLTEYNCHFLFPDDYHQRESVGDNRLIPLPAGMDVRTTTRKSIRAQVEKLSKWSDNYAEARLRSFYNECRTNTNWQELEEQLAVGEAIQWSVNPAAKLAYKLMQSELFCHQGKTDDAIKLNDEIAKRAQHYGEHPQVQKIYALALICRMVVYNDYEDYAGIAQNLPQLHESLKQLDDRDLWMRFWGTLGQCILNCLLYNCRELDEPVKAILATTELNPEKWSLQCFKNARKYAEKASDVAQDLNYCCLLQAMRNPRGFQWDDSWEDACNQQEKLCPDEGKDKNWHFMLRIQYLRHYQYLLQWGELPEGWDDDPWDGIGDWWLKATILKYVGALYAQEGKSAEADKAFSHAMKILADEVQGPLWLMKVSLYAEAWRALKNPEYLRHAQELLMDIPANAPKHSTEMWRQWLANNPDESTFPGKNYIY